MISDVAPKPELVHNGTYADTWKGKRGGKDVCVKIFRDHGERKRERIKAEFYDYIIKWKHVSHVNVLPFEGVTEMRALFGFVTPWMPNNNIVEYIKKDQSANRLQLLAEAACGLQHLHSLGIVHSNITPRNILITDKRTACIGDFEITGIVANPDFADIYATSTFQKGVSPYTAPEQVDSAKFKRVTSSPTKKTDIYSFAMTAYEVLTGNRPYAGCDKPGQLVMEIANNKRPPQPENDVMKKWLPDKIWDTMESCWTPRPTSRPSIGTVYSEFRRSATKVDGSTTKDKSPHRGEPPALPRVEKPPIEQKFLDSVQAIMTRIRSFFRRHSAEQQPAH